MTKALHQKPMDLPWLRPHSTPARRHGTIPRGAGVAEPDPGGPPGSPVHRFDVRPPQLRRPPLPPASQLITSSCNDGRDAGCVRLDSGYGILWKRDLRHFVVLVDPNLDDGQKRTALLSMLTDVSFNLCSNLGRKVGVVAGRVGHPAVFCCHSYSMWRVGRRKKGYPARRVSDTVTTTGRLKPRGLLVVALEAWCPRRPAASMWSIT